MSKHTPGPYRVAFEHEDAFGEVDIRAAEESDGSWITVAKVDLSGGRREERIATARLLGAAPELRNALAQCVAELEEAATILRPQWPGIARIYDAAAHRVRATVAKAEGREP